MLVWIVYLPTADLRGPDVDRMDRVEDLPDDLARALVNEGSARLPSDDEVAAYREALQVEEKAAEAQEQGDLTKLRKDELLRLADERGVVDVNESMTKPEIAKAIEKRAAQPSEPAGQNPIVTVTPGAGQNREPAAEAAP